MSILSTRLKQAGISLLEVLLSLSIIAVILVMATRYFFVASNNEKINTVRQQIGSVVAAVHLWKGQNNTYKGANLPAMYAAGFLADSTDFVSNELFNPWGYKYDVEPFATEVSLSIVLPKESDCISVKNSYSNGSCTIGSNESTFSINIQ